VNAPLTASQLAPAYAVPPQAVVTLPIQGQPTRFPVGRLYCVGRNYADHAREMGHDPNREPPFFFMKPANTIVADGRFPYPSLSSDVHHEVELVVAIGMSGSNIAPEKALEHVYGYAVGLDMTRRDLQTEAKKMGRPWDTGKAFDSSAPCSEIVPAQVCGHLKQGAITLRVNGQVRQSGDLSDLIWNVADTVAYLSTLFALKAGDLIYTGTPAGVGAVQHGDEMVASVAGLPTLAVKVV
jgi:fumarylpyruvate hydrolase